MDQVIISNNGANENEHKSLEIESWDISEHEEAGQNDKGDHQRINSYTNSDVFSDRDLDCEGIFNNVDSESIYTSCEDDSYNISEDISSDTEDKRFSSFDQIMFHASKLSVRDIILICTAFALRFNISDEALLKLLSIFKFCAGPEFTSLNLSKHIVSKCFSSQNEHITYHYYCNTCSERIIFSKQANKPTKVCKRRCEKCKRENSITSASENYFLTIDIAYQIRILFSNPDIFNDIIKSEIVDNNEFNGSIHTKLLAEFNQNNKLDEQYLLTFNCNTDGAPLTKSGKKSFWPLQLCINELPSKFQSKFIILAGLLMVQHEPKSNLMNLYLSKFVEQINHLYKDGISLIHNGTKYMIKFCTHSFPLDSVCRPIVQNRLQFNAYCGCSWCEQLGYYVNAIHGIRYLREQESVLRFHKNHLKYAKEADDIGIPIKGVKGFSALLNLPHMDIVWSFAYEYMHGLLLGVVWQLMNLWKNKDCEYNIKKKDFEEMEKQFLKITPTHDIHRLPRAGIIKGSMKPKASELKSWLLYYSLPCLKDVLHEEALEHFALLVKCAFTLLKSVISESELNKCEEDCVRFVLQFEELYGEGAMTFNVHALMHCVESVRKTGPLSKNSAFPFESFIYTLKTFINGPKGMDVQIARKHLQSIIFESNCKEHLHVCEDTANYCYNFFTPNRMSKFFKEIEDVTFCGRGEFVENEQIGKCVAYKKCIYKGVVYHNLEYVQGQKTDDSYIELMNSKFCRILQIFHCANNSCKLKLMPIQIYSDDPFHEVHHIKKIEKDDIKNIIFTDIHDVKSKVIAVNVKNARYLCTMPNTFEIQ